MPSIMFGEVYFSIETNVSTGLIDVERLVWVDSERDTNRLKELNAFVSKYEAETAAEKIRELLKKIGLGRQ